LTDGNFKDKEKYFGNPTKVKLLLFYISGEFEGLK
jgi:hypothetical protein